MSNHGTALQADSTNGEAQLGQLGALSPSTGVREGLG